MVLYQCSWRFCHVQTQRAALSNFVHDYYTLIISIHTSLFPFSLKTYLLYCSLNPSLHSSSVFCNVSGCFCHNATSCASCPFPSISYLEMTTFNMTNFSCSFKAPSSCCIGTGRSPPSPDGDAPRSASSSKPGKRLSKDHIPTWRTIETETNQTAELRAIFEEETAGEVNEIPRIKHKGTAVFREMLAINDDSSDKESIKIKPRKSSNTLKTVTQKLKKHLSRDSALSKRYSRSSVGTSEEEVERRAELRRIRERRIREELSNEGVYDDDAKSASSVAVASTSPPRTKRSHFLWSPGNQLPLPLLTPPALPLPKLSFPHLSPLPR